MIALVGDNSNVLTDREKEAHFGHMARKIRAYDQQIEDLKAKRKAELADAKNDGINVKELEVWLKALNDGDKMLDKHKLTESALKRAGLLSGAPSKDLLDRVDREELIFAQGKAAGLVGADCASGYDAGSADDKLWINGWKEGQRIVLDEWVSANAKLQRKRGVPDELPDDPFESDL